MCCRGQGEEEPLVVQVQNEPPAGSFRDSSSDDRAGVLVCQQSGSRLVVAYADDALRAALGVPTGKPIAGLPLADVLPAGSTAACERALSAAAADLPIRFDLPEREGSRGLELLLAPATAAGLWVGRLTPEQVEPGVRIEAADLKLVDRTFASSSRLIPRVFPFVDALDATRALIAIRDADDRYVLVNSVLAEFYGLRCADLVGRTPSELANDKGPLLGVPPPLPADGTPAIARNVVLKDAVGRRRRFDVLRQGLRGSDLLSHYVIEVATELPPGAAESDEPAVEMRDAAPTILTRAVLPEPAQAAMSMLAAALDAAEFHCTTIPDLKLTRLGEAAQAIFGVPAGTLLGSVNKMLAFAAAGNGPERARRWQQRAGERKPWQDELEILNALGEPRWIKVLGQPIGGDYFGVLVDVTPAKLLGVRLEDTQAQLDVALTNADIGLVDWHVDSDRLASNRQLSKLLELPESQPLATGRELASLAHPKDKARVHMELQGHLAGETTAFHCEYRLKTGRNRWRWVLASGRVVKRAAGGEPLRYIGTLQDVTEPLETEQELERQVAKSQEVARASTELEREVRQLEAEIREISHREQERLGRDLHDGLGQELTGVSLLLKSLEQAVDRDAPQLGPRVHSVRDLVEQCIATTRALAQGLAPVDLDRDGLVGALRQLAANTESVYGIAVHFSAETNGAEPGLSAATDVYRIAQEAVINAAKHARAREIGLKLKISHDITEIVVEDDGEGISADGRSQGGMGLKIMRYRAGIIGASLDIGPREGGGTVVRCVLRPGIRAGVENRGVGND